MGEYLQLKYAVAIIVAFSIDALQFLLGVAIAAAFFHPATALAILGCVVSNSYVVQGTCWIGGIVGFGVGAIASVLFPPLIALSDALGAGLAALVDFCLSVVGLAIVLPMLIVNGISLPGNFFSSWRRTPFIIAKIIPGIDMLPFFTGMVIMSIIETETLKAQNKPAGIRVAAARAQENLKTASPGLYRENLSARFTQEQLIALRQLASARLRQQSQEKPVHVPLTDRITAAKENPDSALAQNSRSTAALRAERAATAPSRHVLNLAS